MIGPKIQELSASSQAALAAIFKKDEEALKEAIAGARKKIAGVISWKTPLAPHLLSTAASIGWVKGMELLMPIDNQWQPQLVNWSTRRPAALGEDKPSSSEDMAFWQDVACSPLGFACISGQAKCVKVILNSQGGRRRWPADLSQSQGLGALDFLIRQGGVKELKTYLAGGGDALVEDPQGTILGLWAIERLLADNRPGNPSGAEPSAGMMVEADKRAAAMLRLLAENGLSATGGRASMGDGGARNRAQALWTSCLRQSAPETTRELLRQGVSANFVKTETGAQRPLSLAASQENPLLHDLSAKTIVALLGAGAQADYLEEAPGDVSGLAPALMFAIHAKNWAAAKALAGSTAKTPALLELLESPSFGAAKDMDLFSMLRSNKLSPSVAESGSSERAEARQPSAPASPGAHGESAPDAQSEPRELEERLLAAESRANDLEEELASMRRLVRLMEERMDAAGLADRASDVGKGLLNYRARAAMNIAVNSPDEIPRSTSKRRA